MDVRAQGPDLVGTGTDSPVAQPASRLFLQNGPHSTMGCRKDESTAQLFSLMKF